MVEEGIFNPFTSSVTQTSGERFNSTTLMSFYNRKLNVMEREWTNGFFVVNKRLLVSPLQTFLYSCDRHINLTYKQYREKCIGPLAAGFTKGLSPFLNVA